MMSQLYSVNIFDFGCGLGCESFVQHRRRLYQYNKGDFRLPSFQTAWIYINMETVAICQLTDSLCLPMNLLFKKKLARNQNLNRKFIFIVLI